MTDAGRASMYASQYMPEGYSLKLELLFLQAIAAVREEDARLCDEADKSTHPAELADRIRARSQGK